MTFYPANIDDDTSIIRIDDNLSELGGTAINQLREAVFAIEKTLGINPQGSMISLADFLDVSFNSDGTIKTSALQAVGLATLPIHNNQVAATAGIQESKLDLDYATADLNTKIASLQALVDGFSDLVNETGTDLLIHIGGGEKLSNNSTLARHVASHIDINDVPTDARDTYTWTGLFDKDGVQRNATHVAAALLEINNDFINHQNTISDAHPATAITVETKDFTEFPIDINNVQEALEFIDDQETVSQGIDRAIMHENGIPRKTRVEKLDVDGYSLNVIPVTPVEAYLAEPNGTAPKDNINNGDDVIKFLPDDNSDFSFDAKFTNVKVGDILRINYGNGVEGAFPIKSIRFVPGSEWVVRVDTYNLVSAKGLDGYVGEARIDQSRFDNSTFGALAVAGVVPDTNPGGACDGSVGSVIVANPRGAAALGLGFDPNQIDTTHYNLYLKLYPNGDPESAAVDLPAIDVSGNAGATPGKYSLDRIVEETNKQFRKAGYNFRFIAFNRNGEFGVMLADHYGGAAFSIVSGSVNGASLEVGQFTNNVIGDGAGDGYDGLGLGGTKAGFASPDSSSFSDGVAAASYPTLVISPVRGRYSYVDGRRSDLIAGSDFTQGTEADGYWLATISDVTTSIIDNTKTVQYTVDLDLRNQEIKKGKTIVVQPESFDSTATNGYGRFIIGDVSFVQSCPGVGDGYCQTNIMVINGVHATGDPLANTPEVGTIVRLYFSEDSVGFNVDNIIESGVEYHRYHEIFINRSGETVSQERARMDKQTESGVLLGTTSSGWRIRNVSPKFKGEQDADFRYFTRFVMSNYNSSTGEFDGYLADPDGSGITNPGPTVRGRKDHPVRFYDNTYVNFIDIEFREDATSPGTTLMPDTMSRYVDIEIFPTLRTNDEWFVLSGVSHDESTFLSATDLREFGTVSEENFTDSAMKFIQAGERYLHANGVVRGFEYEGTEPQSEALLEFTGGLALVNGAFVALDSMYVKLPEVKSSTSNVVEFFICVTEGGQLHALVKDIGAEFFDVQNGDWIPTISFKEIVDKRKDLTIIACVTATIADQDGGGVTYSLDAVNDARRFVFNQDIHGPWSVTNASEADGYFATFRSEQAMICWVNEYEIEEVRIVHLDVNDSSIDLTTLENPVKFIGGTVSVNSADGVILKSGVTIDGTTFVYNYEWPGVVGTDNSHLVDGNACVNIASSASDVTIVNCTFRQDVAVERPPFIAHFYNEDGNNIKINNNKFEESSNTLNCAIGLFYLNGLLDNRSTLNNVNIDNNTISGSGSILIVSASSSRSPRLIDVSISNNNMPNGLIGWVGGNQSSTATASTTHVGIRVFGNYCNVICTADENGKFTLSPSQNTCAQYITDNNCSFIHILTVSTNDNSVTKINNNTLWKVGSVPNTDFNITQDAAIYCAGTVGNDSVSISNNTIMKRLNTSAPSVYYQNGILSTIGGIIDNNQIVESFTSIGILFSSGNGNVRGNKISKDQDISAYISLLTVGGVICTDNRLDARYNDAGLTDDETIVYDPQYHVVERNINQIKNIQIHLTNWIIDNDFYPVPVAGSTAIDTINIVDNSYKAIIDCITGSSAVSVFGNYPAESILPLGSKIIEVSISYNAVDVNWNASSSLSVLLRRGISIDIGTNTQSFNSSSSGTVTINATTGTTVLDESQSSIENGLGINISCANLDPTVGNKSLTLNSFNVKYTY